MKAIKMEQIDGLMLNRTQIEENLAFLKKILYN